MCIHVSMRACLHALSGVLICGNASFTYQDKSTKSQSGVNSITLPPALNLLGHGLVERTGSQVNPRGLHCIFRSS